MSGKFTKAEEQDIIRAYEKNSQLLAIASAFHCSSGTIRRLLLRNQIEIQVAESHQGRYVPTLEQIAEAKEEIQKTWDKTTRGERQVQKPERVTVTRVNDGRDRSRKLRASELNG